MNGSSLQNNENPYYCDGPLPEGLSLGTAGQGGYDVVVETAAAASHGCGGVHHNYTKNIFNYYLNNLIFRGKRILLKCNAPPSCATNPPLRDASPLRQDK
jgi:hypothetical protein